MVKCALLESCDFCQTFPQRFSRLAVPVSKPIDDQQTRPPTVVLTVPERGYLYL